MIISKTPFRISFVGGGSDLPAFYKQHKGAVLSTTINKYMYISSHRYFEQDKIRCKYSETETVANAAQLKHPIFRTVLQDTGMTGIEISSIADIPSGTGMGSSSSFTVGLLHNMAAVQGRYVTKHDLGKGACRIELDLLGEPIGKQDQYAAAFGGMNVIEFLPNGEVHVDPVYISTETRERLDKNLMLFYIGNKRSASKILAEQSKNATEAKKVEALKTMVSFVYDLKKILIQGDLDSFGHLMNENWKLKQQLAAGISNPRINELYNAAMESGALGGKLLGAGGGGFMLFYAPEHAQEALVDRMKSLDASLFDFSMEREGSKIIHFERD